MSVGTLRYFFLPPMLLKSGVPSSLTADLGLRSTSLAPGVSARMLKALTAETGLSLGRRATTRATAPPRTTAAPPATRMAGLIPPAAWSAEATAIPPLAADWYASTAASDAVETVSVTTSDAASTVSATVVTTASAASSARSKMACAAWALTPCLAAFLDSAASERRRYVRACVRAYAGARRQEPALVPPVGAGRGAGRGERKEGLTTREASGPSLARATYFRRRLDERTLGRRYGRHLLRRPLTHKHTLEQVAVVVVLAFPRARSRSKISRDRHKLGGCLILSQCFL